MIVYNVLEEIRIVVYLLTLGIFIPTNYDLLKIIESKKRTLTIITKSLGSLLILILCYLFIYRLKEGYVPQYGILIVLLGIVVYYVLLRKKFLIQSTVSLLVVGHLQQRNTLVRKSKLGNFGIIQRLAKNFPKVSIIVITPRVR